MPFNLTPQGPNGLQYAYGGRFPYDSNVSGAGDYILLGALKGPLSISALGPASLVASVQGTFSPPEAVTAGTAQWLDITGLTAIANTVKQVSITGPYTAIRPNIGTPQVGTLNIDVLMGSYATYVG